MDATKGKYMQYIDTFQRVEHKYLMNQESANALYKMIQDYIQSDQYPFYKLYNIYYDTDDYRMISHSIGGPVYKEKLRLRSYGEISDNPYVYFEMKRKYNGIVYKRRIQISSNEWHEDYKDSSQIGNELSYMKKMYDAKRKVFIAYDRYAFQSIHDSDVRITFDTSIRYRLHHLDLTDSYKDTYLLDNKSVLVEIKVMNRYPLWLVDALSKLKLQRTSFSKYGVIYENILKGRNSYVSINSNNN